MAGDRCYFLKNGYFLKEIKTFELPKSSIHLLVLSWYFCCTFTAKPDQPSTNFSQQMFLNFDIESSILFYFYKAFNWVLLRYHNAILLW